MGPSDAGHDVPKGRHIILHVMLKKLSRTENLLKHMVKYCSPGVVGD